MNQVQRLFMLAALERLNIAPRSLVVDAGVEYALAWIDGTQRFAALAPNSSLLEDFEGKTSEQDGGVPLLGPCNARNAAALLQRLLWLQPWTLGLQTSAELQRAPRPEDVTDADLPELLSQFDTREIFHVTFGSVLTTRTDSGQWLFYDRLMALLRANPEAYAKNLEAYFVRHLQPFAVAQQSLS